MIVLAVEDFVADLQPIASEIGVQAARDLVSQFGGTRLYVPKHWRPELAFNAVIGESLGQQLCQLFGPERIEMPIVAFTKAGAVRIAQALHTEGRLHNEIARELGMSRRNVTRLLSGAPAPLTRGRKRVRDERQVDLEELLRALPKAS